MCSAPPKGLLITLMVTVLMISIACDRAQSSGPTASEPTPDVPATVSASVQATITASDNSGSQLNPLPAAPSAPTPDIQTPISEEVESAVAGLPSAGSDPEPLPAADKSELPASSSTSSSFTSTVFDPASVTLPSIGASELVILRTSNLDPGVDGVQANIQHPQVLEVSSPVCTGLFQGATSLPTVEMSGGTLIGCFFLSGDVKNTDGAVITFQLTRVGDFSQEQVLTLGLKGGTGTQFSDNGRPISPGLTDQLMVKP